MKNELGEHIRSARVGRGLSRGQVAEAMGYRNVSKGARRITALERGEMQDRDFLNSIIQALDLDPTVVAGLIEARQAEAHAWLEEWLSEQIIPHLVVRYCPAVYLAEDLPAELTDRDEMIAYAARRAREKNKKVCLVLSRRESIYFDEQGEYRVTVQAEDGVSAAPSVSVRGGQRFLFRVQGGNNEKA